ncbi:MAG: MFS transporter [candidate division NC10 bacterium]|nr:MFS transporter [candidate division NC10 bacterium]
MKRTPLFFIMASHLVVDLSQNILPVILPIQKAAFGLTYSQAGLVATSLNVTSSMIQPLFGLISDRWRTDWFISLGILWTPLFMGLCGLAPSYPLLLLSVTLAGFGTAAFHPRASMTVNYLSGSRRGLGMAIYTLGGNLGFALGPLFAALLVLRWGVRSTAWLFALGLPLSLILFASKKEVAISPPCRTSPSKPIEWSKMPWLELGALSLVVALRSWTYQGFIVYLPLLLQSKGVNLQVGSHFLFVFLLSGAIAGLAGGHLSDQWGRQRVIAGSLLLFSPLMLLALNASGPWVPLFLALSGIMLLAGFSVIIVFAQELMPGNVGLASGLMLGLAFGAGGIGVFLSGLMADAMGLARSMRILALLPLLAGLLALFLKDRHPKGSAASNS